MKSRKLLIFLLFMLVLVNSMFVLAEGEDDFQEIINSPNVIVENLDFGKLYVLAPSEVYEDTKFIIKTALVIQKEDSQGDLRIYDEETVDLIPSFVAGDATETDPFILGVWEDVIQADKLYFYEIVSNDSIVVQKGFVVKALENTILNETIVDVELPQSQENNEHIQFLLENKGISYSSQEFEDAKLLAEENIILTKSAKYIERKFANGSNEVFTNIEIKIQSNERINSFFLIETIPKVIAENVAMLTLSNPNYVVLEEDPVIMWHLEGVDATLSYEVPGEIETTGYTTILVESSTKNSFLKALFPVLIIPFIAIIIVYFSRFSPTSKK